MKQLIVVTALAALLLAGCGGGTTENGTDGGNGGTAAGETAADCDPRSGTVSVTAETGSTNAFDTDCIAVQSGQETSLELKNPDGEPHNLSVLSEKGGEKLFNGPFVNPGENGSYTIPALDAGDRYFQCDIHPEMNGTFKIV